PAEGASTMYDLPLRHTADAVTSGGKEFAIELVHNGGTGARPMLDGLSATAYPSGVFGSQVEMTEAAAPVTIWRRELRRDSGGPGTFRGGLGQSIEMTSAIEEPFLVFLSVERIANPAKGRAGGGDGAPGRIRVSGRPADIPGKCALRVDPGERLYFDTPGGGGFGDPAARDPRALADDVSAGFVSPEAAEKDYGGSS
ncbi:MAG: hydantoinase B/oxoprolinase family protein, partial [Pseudomonadota bacterium]